MNPIDLRSDTITQPSQAMREFMMNAEVGDDVYGEDPTVNALQNKICELTGKEAALFVSSGTQANQVSLSAHTEPGNEIICEYRSHIFNYESGAAALLSGIQLHPLISEYGILDLEQVENAIRPKEDHYPKTRVIAVENTHNRWGGTIYPLEEIKKLRLLADEYGLLMHLDGARLWNASVATGVSLKEYASFFDSVSLCFSKGLGAPVGSIVVGSKAFIRRAHYYRKAFGGGMRQAGFLAAAAIYAIDHNFERLVDDHRRARTLAETINDLPPFVVNLRTVETNIVIIDTSISGLSAPYVSEKLAENGLRVSAISPTRLRAVTHLHFDDNQLDKAIEIFKSTKF
ncbi:MAG TPA: low-specificity L-threonine aldolase [Caldithrix abyssi]|uniref:Low-specificity L-threonine aldolase n=1 Tax=Caldithrix abyssi TaxID=187145 RepID=A0A7V4U377_CALAY|nr:low-specificity L-threonine aldolase [Caldithrix abyssi]